MDRFSKAVVSFTPDEVAAMLRDALKANGVTQKPIGVQIIVEKPFGDGMKVHNEVPRLTVVLSNVGL